MARRLRVGPIIGAACFLVFHLGVALALFHYAAKGNAALLVDPETGPTDDLPGFLATIFWYPVSYLVGPMAHMPPGLFIVPLVLTSLLWSFAFYLMIIISSYLDIRPDEEEGDGTGKPGELVKMEPPPRSWKLWWTVFGIHFLLVIIFVYCRSTAFLSWMEHGAPGLSWILYFFLFYPIGPLWGKAAAYGLALFPALNGVCWAFVAMHAARWIVFLSWRAKGRRYTPPFAKG